MEVISFKTLPLYRRGKSPRYSLDRKFGESQSRSGLFVVVNIFELNPDSNLDPSTVQPQINRPIE
jgi:hypothetical protein